MYQRRFKNKQGRRILNLQGRVSLMHLGGGAFLYSFPGRRFPIVGRVELFKRSHRRGLLGALALAGIGFLFFNIVASAGQADPIADISELQKLEAEGRYQELEQRTEEVKARLLHIEEERSRQSGQVKLIEYTVRAGDTLSSVAIRYRVPAALVAVSSGLDAGAALKPGQKLLIPDRPGLLYKFKAGDRLADIAQRYQVKLEDIIADNAELGDLDMIEPGARIFLPNARIPTPPPIWFKPAWGRLTSGFGYRRDPLLGNWSLHSGIDIGIAYASVRAAREGQVMYVGSLGGYGNVVLIRHEGGYKTLYAHLSRLSVRAGQFVAAGAVIGVSGNTGRSTGPHLHFEVIKNDRPVNPRAFVRF
ncbi:MAG: M23 family metallopeptidase [Leptospirales bacterium]|nr:M23 family metallopeptidase [Leptospirales bacterium]